jgi:uncharacterized membrane protein
VLIRALVIAALAWVAAITLAPLAIASGRAGLSLGAAAVYGVGARICHQRPERCFRIDGVPMPVCARCTGLYAGAAAAAPLALVMASGAAGISARRARRIAAAAALPTLLTWSLEMAGLAHPSNIVRALAALPLGFAAAWLVIASLAHGPRPRHEARRDH